MKVIVLYFQFLWALFPHLMHTVDRSSATREALFAVFLKNTVEFGIA
jgi:hypothetical protein